MEARWKVMVREEPSEQDLSRVLRIKILEADFLLSGPLTPITIQHVSGGWEDQRYWILGG